MSERGEIKRDGATAQKNSGRGKIQKGDAIWHGFVVDYKEFSGGFTVNRNVWSKICTDAFKSGYGKPLLKLVLGKDMHKTRLAVIEWSELEELVRIRDERESGQ